MESTDVDCGIGSTLIKESGSELGSVWHFEELEVEYKFNWRWKWLNFYGSELGSV